MRPSRQDCDDRRDKSVCTTPTAAATSARLVSHRSTRQVHRLPLAPLRPQQYHRTQHQDHQSPGHLARRLTARLVGPRLARLKTIAAAGQPARSRHAAQLHVPARTLCAPPGVYTSLPGPRAHLEVIRIQPELWNARPVWAAASRAPGCCCNGGCGVAGSLYPEDPLTLSPPPRVSRHAGLDAGAIASTAGAVRHRRTSENAARSSGDPGRRGENTGELRDHHE